MSFRKAALALLALGGCHESGQTPPRTGPGPAAVGAPAPTPARANLLFAIPPAITTQKHEPSFSLMAADGRALRLDRFEVKAVVDGPLAFTEVRLTFENPEDRVLEGTFKIALPRRASIGRLAMKIDGAWQEGEVVEKKAARLAYEDFLHRRQDPALLEGSGTNELSLRIFPIGPRAKKELVVSYSEELTGDAYTLPMHGLPTVGTADVHVFAAGTELEGLHETAYTPTADFVVFTGARAGAGAGAGGGAPPTSALRSGDLVVLQVSPAPDTKPDPLASAIVLVDTSASRALGLTDEVKLVKEVAALVAAAGPDVKIAIASFDQAVDPVFEGTAKNLTDGALARIVNRGALGASDLAAAIDWAGRAAPRVGAKRVIIVTDGVATAGRTGAAELGTHVRDLAKAGIERVDTLALGGIRDEAVLRRLVTVGLPHDGAVIDGASSPAELRRRLGESSHAVPVTIEGARFVWPKTLEGVQRGDVRTLYAEVPAGAPLRGKLGAKPATWASRDSNPSLVERAWATAKIASLVEREAIEGPNEPLRKEMVAISSSKRVLSPYTSMLVLETDGDYARFGIDRKQPSSVLTVSNARVAQTAVPKRVLPGDTSRTGGPNAPTAPWGGAGASDPANARGNMWGDAIGDAFGAGGLGLSGVGEGGGGRGEGIGLGSVGTIGHGAGASAGSTSSTGTGSGFGAGAGRIGGSHATRAPQIRAGATQVNGRMPPEVIQRIVRQNFGRMRLCYEQGLARDPALQGKVVIRLIIDRQGSVASASAAAGTDLLDPAVVACVTRAMSGLSFPQPEGGLVTVNYPIQFGGGEGARGGSSSPAPTQAATKAPPLAPYTGRFRDVMASLSTPKRAFDLAAAWHAEEPGDVLALVALGESLEALEDWPQAARAYGSIVDLYSTRADLRRFAGERLERVGAKDKSALGIAFDSYQKARDDRSDHPSVHHLLAFSEVKQRRFETAFSTLEHGLEARRADSRFPGVERILREDLGLVAAAWAAAEPARTEQIRARLAAAGGVAEDGPSIRFVLTWETDANDVDFHIHDAEGGHAYYGEKMLKSGGELYADVTQGYGPECFTIRGQELRAPYRLEAHYYARGPMGYGMGKLQIIRHDGKGALAFEERPFVVMNDRAFVDLGEVSR
jgi:hypothetical protein